MLLIQAPEVLWEPVRDIHFSDVSSLTRVWILASVAAVVSSIDNHFAQYPGSLEMQESKKEVIRRFGRQHQFFC